MYLFISLRIILRVGLSKSSKLKVLFSYWCGLDWLVTEMAEVAEERLSKDGFLIPNRPRKDLDVGGLEDKICDVPAIGSLVLIPPPLPIRIEEDIGPETTQSPPGIFIFIFFHGWSKISKKKKKQNHKEKSTNIKSLNFSITVQYRTYTCSISFQVNENKFEITKYTNSTRTLLYK